MYVILRIIGDMDPRVALQVTVEAHKLGRELGVKRYLCDFRECRNIGSVYDNYWFAYDGTQMSVDIDNSARVATLISPDDQSHNSSVTFGRNSGKDLVPFTNLDAAVYYLVKD